MERSHFVVLSHGVESPFGSLCDMDFIVEALRKKEIFKNAKIISTQVNIGASGDGIDIGGLRIADEIESVVNQAITSPNYDGRKFLFSFIGHSLGGLYGRYCMGELYRRGLFDSILEPVSFLTIATPHLGSKKKLRPQIREMQYEFIEDISHAWWPGNTMDQLLYEDATEPSPFSPLSSSSPMFAEEYQYLHHKGLPLLYRMTLPQSFFYKALSLFRSRTAIAAVRWDMLVPFCSSLLTFSNPFYKMGDYKLDNKISVKDGFEDEVSKNLGSIVGMSKFTVSGNEHWQLLPSMKTKRLEKFQYRKTCISSEFPETTMVLDVESLQNLQSLEW
eukprot:CAMPEP_0201491218 /NCGR_PEP_ID=MMETSP0151_2-20130828/28999_1 /ASSEMBLY_ACC=CAM_ASM_000257 /TAXON_ID=200890 /ORGANISM="Paramoeba atlantica, Strain 621/1 / CCAP 1560/9" /LENGTH=331 /DNA_ID=CAMNT_0047877475 /DNA_START=54 /DNA_END=1046 /DNA_ORIENTATION=+